MVLKTWEKFNYQFFLKINSHSKKLYHDEEKNTSLKNIFG